MYHALPTLQKRLAELEKTEANELLRFELSAGIEFVHEYWGHTMEALRSLVPGQISFDHMWTMYHPGCLLYARDELMEGQAYRFKSCDYVETQDRSKIFVISVESLDSDGRRFGYVKKKITVGQFGATTSITDLRIYPLEEHPKHEEERAYLMKRAHKALSLQGRHLQEYEGHALEPETDPNLRHNPHVPRFKKFTSHGRVMLDPALYEVVDPTNYMTPVIERVVQLEDVRDEDKILMHSMLYGFSLGDKVWGGFSVSRLSAVDWNPSVFDSVIIDGGRKKFLESLVRNHSSRTAQNSFDDIVRDKGKGLVGLFCGPPGLGKTLTAEAVAEVARRPLITLSSGEMGDNSISVEKRLNAEFRLAEAWNAVLLLDEADVFMAERSNDNLAQNAITSVFLRKLEYYQGILLLTTNRMERIDSAFDSRIHFRFNFEDLDADARASIWKTFLTKAGGKGEVKVQISDEERKGLAARKLNGRQIKNIVSVSRAYALQESVPLDLDVVQMAVNFTQFDAATSGETGEEERSRKKRKVPEYLR